MLALVVVIGLLTVACGGETVRFQASLTPTPTATPTATPEPTLTPTPVPTPTPTPDPAAICTECWPLNGRPLADMSAATKRPLLVKIDNAPVARPHYGISQADMVFEEIVEGGITRLAAVFQSQDPKTVGGVRSARLADRSLTTMVRGALVYSGTSAYAWGFISKDAASGRYVELSADHSGGYYRVDFRTIPYNMFTSAQAQRDVLTELGKATVKSVPAWPFFNSTDHAATIGGMDSAVPATEITIPYREDSSRVTYQYDPASRTYARYQNKSGQPVRDVDAANNVAIAAAQVVIIQTDIWDVPQIVDASGSVSNDQRLTGTGTATIFRDGLRQEGTWSRANDNVAFTFTSASGAKITFNPGQTWVHVIPTDWSVTSR